MILAVLFFGGLLRSLQFTALNALTHAEVEQHELSGATTLASTAQQLAATLGIAFGSAALEAASALLPPRDGGTPYACAFVAAGVIAALSSRWAWRLRLRPARVERSSLGDPSSKLHA